MECKIVGCKTKVIGMAWASHSMRPLYIKAGHASPRCSKTFLISKKGKISTHNPVATSLKIRFTVGSLQLKHEVGSLQPHGPTAFWFGLNLQGQSELTATNAPVGRSVHWMGCVFSFGAGWGS
jgi:hypothetical protein